jgi:Isochorismatase family
MSLLLTPADTIVIAVSSPDAAAPTHSLTRHNPADLIVRAATVSSVPILWTQYLVTANESITTAAAAASTTKRPHALDIRTPDWSKTPLGVAVAHFNRTNLIVMGYWLEEAVSFLVLKALAHSYRVYLVLDAIRVEAADTEDAARQRLIFAGAVPTTAHQIVREWAATTADPACRKALRDLRTT